MSTDNTKLKNKVPPYHALFNPLLQVMRSLGGSGSIEEIDINILDFIPGSQEINDILHNPESGAQTEVEYRTGWARTYLKKYGLIDNSSKGIWTLTSKAESVGEVDPAEVVRYVRALQIAAAPKEVAAVSLPDSVVDVPPEVEEPWKGQLFRILTKNLDPTAFERLTQRLLRESGFSEVEVTGRTGDGGIDGKGIARIHGLMSFHVVFQCKRYQGVVGAPEIRAFRGAMVGRSDKGLFITTGSFTRDAKKEATRDGAPPIDLLDGDALAEKLKELQLGIKVEMVERVTVDPGWFGAI